MTVLVGYEMKAYRDEASSWVEMDNIRDLEISMERDRADVTTRAANGWKAEKPTLATFEVTGEMLYDPTDANFTAFWNAFLNNTDVEMAFANGDIDTNGTKYIHVTVGVQSFGRNEPLAEGVVVPFTLVASDPNNPPEEVTVPGT